MFRRWSKPALGLVYSLGRIDSGEFVLVLVGHAWRSSSLGGIVFYSNTLLFQASATSSRIQSCAEVGILKRCCQCSFIVALLPTCVVVGLPSGVLKKESVPAPHAFTRPPHSLLTISKYCPWCTPGCRPSKCSRRCLSFARLTSLWTARRAFEYF